MQQAVLSALHFGRRRAGRPVGAALIALLILASPLLHAPAATAAPDFVLQVPEDQVSPGSGAGELNHPWGIAADPSSGHVFVGEYASARISEYTAWGLFVKSWGWGVDDGGAALQSCGPAQPEATPPPSLCQSGTPGAGKGQFNHPLGIALDPAGNVYVFDGDNRRVQKFNQAGQFLLMFGGEVNKTKVEGGAAAAEQNVCPVAPADVCQAGNSGGASSHFAGGLGNYIAYSPTGGGAIVVGDEGRIQIFDLDGSFREEIPFKGALDAFAGKTVNALDVDSVGNIYLSFSGSEDLYKLSVAGEPLAPGKPSESKFAVGNPLVVEVDTEGNVYAVDDPPGALPALEARVVEFDPAGNKLMPTEGEEEVGEFFPYVPFLGPRLDGLATNICAGSEEPGSLYVSFFTDHAVSKFNAYGSGPVGCEPPPAKPPVILAEYATSVGREEATLKARVNPRFWTDATYYVEYGTGKCSEGGCGAKEPIPPASLTSKAVNGAVSTAGVVLGGLQAGTTYHYRFVAQSSGGGPTIGEELSFRTFALAGPPPSCPANEAFRSGPSAMLPDCRAYELVSPLDKENGDVASWLGRAGLVPRLLEIDQSAPSGERFTFTSGTAFADPQGATYLAQYLADRDPAAGWSSRSISPPVTASPVEATAALSGEFQGFSADLCTSWIRHYSVATLAEGAIEKFPNIYRRENCSQAPSYEALTTVKPQNQPSDYFELRALGMSDDGTHSIFAANGKLSSDAPATQTYDRLLYEHTPEGLRFVCYLPSGKASPTACSAGTAGGSGGGNLSSVRNAISDDGSRIFWSAYSGVPVIGANTGVPGQIYVRIDGQETVAASRSVPGSVATDKATYWTAAADGSRVIFEFASGARKDELYEFDVESKTASLIAKGVEGPMGASEDASRIYFASSEDLDDGGPASAGNHNLYLYQASEGAFSFIMTLATMDMLGSDTEPAPIDETPAQRSASVSPDGLHVAFTSAVSPTPDGYDNFDANSGEPNQEVYRYDAEEETLLCVSCNPSGARPKGESIGSNSFPRYVAARIQGWEALGHAPHVLADDGSRIYFESHEALVPGDTNSAWDVYQWEEAGVGSCTEAEVTFSESAEGCIELISSGESPTNSTFLDADPSGKSVFIGTLSSLLPQDYGLNDVYVARIGGGFAAPQSPSACEGEACQGPFSPPEDPTPASSAFQGAGNANKAPRAICRKPKVRRRGRCVAKRTKRASHKRRAAR